jgi:hypothetical protein
VKRTIAMIVLGIGGLAAAIALTVGALALAGDVGTVVQPRLTPSRSESASNTPTPSPDEDRSETPSPSVDDHAGSDDASGDNSGSGSDNSGPGSDSSGSGSDGSGSGSGDSGSHDD